MSLATLNGRQAEARLAMSKVVARLLRGTPALAGPGEDLPVVLALTDGLLEAGAQMPSEADNEHADDERLKVVSDWLAGLPQHLDPALAQIRQFARQQTEGGDGLVSRDVYLAHVATLLSAVDVLAAAAVSTQQQTLEGLLAADDARGPRGQGVPAGTRLVMLRADIRTRLDQQQPSAAAA